MSNLKINTRVRRLSYYLDDFEQGRIRIPLFQRDVVWDYEKKLKLFDSIQHGYPIGTILFWRPEKKEDIESIDFDLNILGSYFLSDKDSDYFYILDGYQRLSTLLNCLIDPNKTKLERDSEIWYREFCIYYDLANDKFNRYQGKDVQNMDVHKILLYKFSDSINFYDFQEAISRENISDETKKLYLQRYKLIGSIFNDYLIPSIDLTGGNLQEAIEIFNRVNSTGSPIKDDWKLSALTINNNFRLGTLISDTLVKIETLNFYTSKKRDAFKDKFIFKTIQSSFGLLYLDTKGTDVITLSKEPNFSEIVNLTLANSIEVVKFLREELLILDLKYLPANLQFIFLVQYFNIKGKPSGDQVSIIKKWFWKTTYSNYFTILNPAKRKKAFNHFLRFARNEEIDPFYEDEDIKEYFTEKFPTNIDFGGVRKIALALFMLNYSVYGENILNAKPIDNIKGISEIKLFKEYKTAENMIFMLKGLYSEQKLYSKVVSSLSFFDESDLNDKYFIEGSIRNEFLKGNASHALALRKVFIQREERKFVENILGIRYTI